MRVVTNKKIKEIKKQQYGTVKKCPGYKCSDGRVFSEESMANIYEGRLQLKAKLVDTIKECFEEIEEKAKKVLLEVYELHDANGTWASWQLSLQSCNRELFFEDIIDKRDQRVEMSWDSEKLFYALLLISNILEGNVFSKHSNSEIRKGRKKTNG